MSEKHWPYGLDRCFSSCLQDQTLTEGMDFLTLGAVSRCLLEKLVSNEITMPSTYHNRVLGIFLQLNASFTRLLGCECHLKHTYPYSVCQMILSDIICDDEPCNRTTASSTLPVDLSIRDSEA
jgi:hypothetical protein